MQAHLSWPSDPDAPLCGTNDDQIVVTYAQWMKFTGLLEQDDPFAAEDTCPHCIYRSWES